MAPSIERAGPYGRTLLTSRVDGLPAREQDFDGKPTARPGFDLTESLKNAADWLESLVQQTHFHDQNPDDLTNQLDISKIIAAESRRSADRKNRTGNLRQFYLEDELHSSSSALNQQDLDNPIACESDPFIDTESGTGNRRKLHQEDEVDSASSANISTPSSSSAWRSPSYWQKDNNTFINQFVPLFGPVTERYNFLNQCREAEISFKRDQAIKDLVQGKDPSRSRCVATRKQYMQMAQTDVDLKFLGQFAKNVTYDHPFLSQNLFKVIGNLVMLSDYVIMARKQRKIDTARNHKSTDLYARVIWYAREGLQILEDWILPMVANFGPLKVLCHKIRASYYHLYVLFRNNPSIRLKSNTTGEVHTPPGLQSPRHATKPDKGKGPDLGDGSLTRAPIHHPSSVQPTQPLEGGPVRGISFLVPSADYRPIALQCFQEATHLAEKLLWGSHPLRLSVRVEYCAFLYDCLHERDSSRQMAKATIAEVYNAQEGMDDDMFEDAAGLVGLLGKMMKRGKGTGKSEGGSASSAGRTPPKDSGSLGVGGRPSGARSAGMDNAI